MKDPKGSDGKDKMKGKDITVATARQIALEKIKCDFRDSLELVECTESTSELACYLNGRPPEDCYFFHVRSRTLRTGEGRIICISKQNGYVVFDGNVGE